MLKRLLFIACTLVFCQNIFATHLVGGEMTYIHVSGNTYQVTLTVYRDNFNGNAPFDIPAMVLLYDDNGNYISAHQFSLNNPTQANQLIPNPYPNPCQTVPPNVEIQKGVYTQNITVPNAYMGYHLIYSRCCRNGALINNLLNPQDQGFTATAHIPPTATYQNNSPSYDLPPPIYICLGNQISNDQSGTDLDGDSLYYKVCTPYQGLTPDDPAIAPGGSPPANFGPPFEDIIWQAPYNELNQLGGTPLSIDPNTGLLSGIPNALGSFVVGICIEEYRNGMLLGTTLRDFQYTVTDCNIPAATIPTVGSVPVEEVPGTSGLPPTATILGIYEKNCDNLNVRFENQSTLPGGATATASSASFYWNFGDGTTSTAFEPTHAFADTGTYVVTMAITIGSGAQSCSDTSYYVVYVYPVFEPIFTGDNTCANQSATFFDVSTTAVYDQTAQWEWNFGDGSPTSLVQNPTHQYANPGTYQVIMFARTQKGCTKLDTNQITIYDVPNPNFAPPNPICAGDTAFFTSTSSIANGSINSVVWGLNLGATSTNNSASNFYPNAGTFAIELMAISDNGCKDSISRNLTVNPLPITNTSGNDTICTNSSVQVWANGGTNYAWTPASFFNNANISNPIVSPTVTQYFYVEVSDANNCSSTDSLFIGLKPPPNANAGEDTSVCLNMNNLSVFHSTVQLQATGGVAYAWTPSTGLSATNIANPIASPTITTDYIVTVTDDQNCTANDTVKVVVLNPALDLISVTTDSLCFGDTVSVDVVDHGTISSYTWSPPIFISDPTANEPYFYPPTNTTYTLSIQNYCYLDTDNILIEVLPLPPVDAGLLDSVCMSNTTYQLNASPNNLSFYEWTSTENTFNNPNIFNPIINPTQTATYFVRGIDSIGTFGCANTDSVNIIVYNNPAIDIQFAPAYFGFICQGDSTLLNITTNNGISFQWDNSPYLNNFNTQSVTAFPIDTTTFYATTINIHACSSRDSITVDVQTPINGTIQGDSIMCVGTYLDLTAQGGLYYQWYPPNAHFSSTNYGTTQAAPDSSMQIFVAVSNDCFHDTLYHNITVHQLPTADAGNDLTVIRDDVPGVLQGSGSGNPLWFTTDSSTSYGILNAPNQFNPEVLPHNTVHYILEVTDPNTNCKNYDTTTVNVNVLTLLAFPTGFSPNGDGVNELARILKYLNIQSLEDFSIFNRYGERIFFTDKLDGAWDGTYKGTAQEIGVYTWQIKATTKDQEKIIRKGNITLIR